MIFQRLHHKGDEKMKELTFEQLKKIYKKIPIDENNIILIDVSENKNISKKENDANIYFIDKNNKIIWQIDATNTDFKRDMFISIQIDDQGKLIARRFSGFKYKVDIQTGKAEAAGWEK